MKVTVQVVVLLLVVQLLVAVNAQTVMLKTVLMTIVVQSHGLVMAMKIVKIKHMAVT